MKNNTYKQDKNFKDLTFSKGELLTQQDLDIIESRSTTFYMQDEEYERWLSEEFSSTIFVKFEDGELFDEENMYL